MQLHRPSRTALVAVVAACLVTAGGSATALSIDARRAATLLPDTVIGGVEVGGLRASQAVARLDEKLAAPLRLPLRVHGDGFDETTSAWDLGLRMDAERAVRETLSRQRDGSIVRRLWRMAGGGGDRRTRLVPQLDREPIRAMAAEAAEAVHIAPADARLVLSGGFLRLTPSRTGRTLDAEAAAEVLEKAVLNGSEGAELPVKAVEPQVPTSAYRQAILVRTGENKLYLYENGTVARTYRVATGKPGHRTPTGRFQVINKRRNPTWVNPGSDWAKEMPGRIPPGPDNPLGSRALDLNVSGIRIHGTPDSASIGTDASHGCIRMHMKEAEDLFGRVPVGTPVVIVDTH